MSNIVLQIGQTDWSPDLILSEETEWQFCQPGQLSDFLADALNKKKEGLDEEAAEKVFLSYQCVLLTTEVAEAELELLTDMVEAYTVFFEHNVNLIMDSPQGFLRRKVARPIDFTDKQSQIDWLTSVIYPGQYGDKIRNIDMDISPNFRGQVSYNGHISLELTGEFGEDFQPLMSYRYNVGARGQALELWQEYITEETCEIQLVISKLQRGTTHTISEVVTVSQAELTLPYILEKEEQIGYYAVSVYAKGYGTIKLGALHYRLSRKRLGQYLLGGERLSDTRSQEIMAYFNPGDMKPPLNVYFSGYRPAEGYEGFFMMKRMAGAPFILISDPRIEGGGFYAGSEELEGKVVDFIQRALDYLGFSHKQLILSGISMGSFGALYYAADFEPHAVIVSKAFASIGNSAKAIKLKRPDEFDTSIDVMLNIAGGIGDKEVEITNRHFWDKFNACSFKDTRFAIAYMKQDDFDNTAYADIIANTADKNIYIYGKGYTGRHNDDSGSVNTWFKNQYHDILREEFGRKI